MSNEHKRGLKPVSASTKTISVPEDERIIGTHVYGNLYDIEHNMVDEEALKSAVLAAVNIAKMTLVEVKAWKFGGKKGGVSAIALVTESHVAVHVWREYNYATVDIYTCGDSSAPHAAFDHLVKVLKPKRHQQFFADRSSM